MAGNSSRRGAIKKTGKGNPTAGSGGRVKRGLEGRGPTPKAKDREGHVAYKAAQARREDAPRRAASRPRKAGDAEWIAGRNSVVEALRAAMPVTAVYVAEGAERDGRLREVFRVAADRGISLLEVPRNELDRLTDGAVHQGLAARVPAYEYAHPDDLLDARRRGDGEPPLIVALDSVTDPRNLGAVVRSAAGFGAHGVLVPERRSAGHDRLGVEDLRRRGRPAPGGAGDQPDPAAQGLPGGRLHGGRPGRRRRRLAARPRPRRPARWCVVVGSEGDGLSRLVAETCDQLRQHPDGQRPGVPERRRRRLGRALRHRPAPRSAGSTRVRPRRGGLELVVRLAGDDLLGARAASTVSM